MASQLDLSRRQPLLPLGSDFAVRFYDDAKLDRYKDAVLSVLERTGVRFGSPKALDILAEHGAQVDRASGVVRFAPDLVTAALAKAPRTFWLGLARRHAGPRPRERRDLQHHQRLRHRGHRLAQRRAPAADQGRPLRRSRA